MNSSDRVMRKDLLSKVMSPRRAARFIRDGMNVACSGFTSCGYPKVVPLALAERIRGGDPVRVSLITGASVGEELDEQLASAGAIARRYPYQTGNLISRVINDGSTMYHDIHLSRVAEQVRCGFLGNLDIAIIEATCIMEDGGNNPYFVPYENNTWAHCEVLYAYSVDNKGALDALNPIEFSATLNAIELCMTPLSAFIAPVRKALSPLAGNYNRWQRRISSAFDPHAAADTGFYTEEADFAYERIDPAKRKRFDELRERLKWTDSGPPR